MCVRGDVQVLDAPSPLWLRKHLCPHSHVSETRARYDRKLVLFSRALNAERLSCSVPDGGEGSVMHFTGVGRNHTRTVLLIEYVYATSLRKHLQQRCEERSRYLL